MRLLTILRLVAHLIIIVAVFLVAYRLPIQYRYEDMKDYLGLLSGVSGMVFTLMGIWIAFLYPNALSRLVNPKQIEIADFSEALQDTRRLERIVAAILKSAVVMIVGLFFLLTKIIIYKSTIYIQNSLLIKAAALTVVVELSLMQLGAVLSVIFANVMFINDLHYKRRVRLADSEG